MLTRRKSLAIPLAALSAALALLVTQLPARAPAATPLQASAWATEEQVRIRVVAEPGAQADGTFLAGLEIVLADGWKTYWRMPGTSGVPPTFDWQGSGNLAAAEVQLPAPRRFRDPDGDTVGYKGRVVWPVLIKATSPGQDIVLKLKTEIGVCKDICIPVEARLELTLPGKGAGKSDYVGPWLKLVPRVAAQRRPADPAFNRISARLTDPTPRLLVEATYPAGANDADMFLEAPDGLYVPLPRIVPDADGKRVTFEVDLSRDVELKELKGRELRLTLVGLHGASELRWKLE